MNPQSFLLVSLGCFFLTALLTGVWKYRHMMTTATHRAPYYVDIAHRAALHYSFAVVVLMQFVGPNAFAAPVVLTGCAMLVTGFGSAILTYVRLGLRDDTDNQFRERNLATTWGMYLLVVLEVGGFGILFAGTLLGLRA